MTNIVVNGRFRQQRITGIQRVAQALTSRLKTDVEVIEPDVHNASGVRGHLWEQAVLPFKARGRVIWGPCNVGPLIAERQILTIHGAGVFDHPEWFSDRFVAVNQFLWPKLARKALRIVTVSHFSQSRISEVLSIPASSIDVVWNGVDGHFRPSNEERIALARDAVGLSDRPYFATLSTIEPRKNLDLVLKAWRLAKPKLPSGAALLVMGGQGGNAFRRNPSYASLIEDDVIFSGYVEEDLLPALLSGSLGVLYPSLYEGFGLPVLEAMACGVPAVTTNLTSLPEVGGDVALYVDPLDPSDLASALVRLAESEEWRKALGESGLERARMFGWDRAAERMDEIFSAYGA